MLNPPKKYSIKELTSAKNEPVASEIIHRAIDALPKNHSYEENITLVLQSLADFEPKDSLEAKLCVQASTLFANGMQYLARAEKQEMMCHSEHYLKFALKLLRLHNETIEALNKHRRKGEHRMVVQHVNVNDGGQAAILTNLPKN